jgi:hypothetical protein
LPDSDGKTLVTIGPSAAVVARQKPVFDARLNTPSRALTVETVLHEVILRVRDLDVKTRVQVWTNGHRATDRVIIGID